MATSMTETETAARDPLPAAERVRQAQCGQCWSPSGTPCQRHPRGEHLARYMRAERRGLISRAELVTVVAALDVIAPHVIIVDGAR